MPPRYSSVLDHQALCQKHARQFKGRYLNMLTTYSDQLSDADARRALARNQAGLNWHIESMHRFPPYFVSKAIMQVASEAAKELPDWTPMPDLFPTPSGFMLLEGGYELPNTPDGSEDSDLYRPGEFYLSAISWEPVTFGPDDPEQPSEGEGVHLLWWVHSRVFHPGRMHERDFVHVPNGMAIWPFGDNCSGPPKITGMEEGKEYTPEQIAELNLDSEMQRAITGTILLFMNQTITIQRKMLPDRATRRRIEQESKGQRTAPEIRVVQFRREERTMHPSDYGHTDRKLNVQFVTSGHWKQQPYGPRHSLRRPQWIDAYWKGPEDAPIKNTSVIRAVVR